MADPCSTSTSSAGDDSLRDSVTRRVSPNVAGESQEDLGVNRGARLLATRLLEVSKESTTVISQVSSSNPPLSSHIANTRSPARRHTSFSETTIPRQTIMKALASQPGRSSRWSFNAALPSVSVHEEEARANSTAFQQLSAAMCGIQGGSAATPAAHLAALTSPCYFHKRFDDAVNTDRVLEEIAEACDGMSHSRLMRTALGVREVSKQLQRRPIKRAVKNVMIVTKARDNNLVSLTRELTEWLLSTPRYGSPLGVTVYVDSKLRNSKRFNAAEILQKDARFENMLRYWTPDLCWSSPEKYDLVITLGGDGTVLFTSWLFQRIVPPILSFSLGSLGFLTNFQFSQYKDHLTKIMGHEGMRVNLRMRFTCTVYRQPRKFRSRLTDSPSSSANITSSSSTASLPSLALPEPASDPIEGEQFEVLNELVIDRGPSPYVSNLELYGDGSLLTVIQADGCIFSTPTGSTAYSLSAGGSLVHPDIPAILLTPICPHTLSFRPMLLNDTMQLRVAVPKNSRATAYCSFDGKGRIELRQGDFVTIAASQYPFPTVQAGPMEWFDSIGRTLRWNTRGAQQKGWESAPSGDEPEDATDDQEEHFDIDFDEGDIDIGKDSGYSGEGSSVGDGASPLRKGMSLINLQ